MSLSKKKFRFDTLAMTSNTVRKRGIAKLERDGLAKILRQLGFGFGLLVLGFFDPVLQSSPLRAGAGSRSGPDAACPAR
jgi:hypothetical protein